MFLRIERGAGAPISRQIADQIRAQCLSGTLVPGTRLPSVRQVAQELTVNQNTVLRVYEKLVAERLLEMRHGDGTFVADRLPAGRLKGERGKFVEEFEQMVHQGALLGVSRPEMESLLDSAWKRAPIAGESA